MNIKRGDIYYADLSPVVGSEQGGIRPVLIVQNDVGNKYSPTVIAAAITSQKYKTKLPTHISVDAVDCGLQKDSIVLLEQVRTLDKKRLKERMGNLPTDEMNKVNRALSVSFGLAYSCFWIMLLSGAGLFASIAIPIIGAACTTYWLKLNGYILKWLPSRVIDIKNELRWRNDIFPLQWRIALSWASGYLIFNLFIPVVFSRYGAIEAGRLGMALTVFSSISTIGMSWVNAKAPNFTMYISRGERKKLNTVFQAVFFRSVLATALLSLGIVVLGWYLNYLEILLMMRISSPKILMILAGVTIANSMVFSMAIDMRAHREEPMLIQSIIVRLIIGFGVYFISIIGIFEMMFFYMIVSIAISFPWTAWIFLKYFKRQ